MKITQSELIAVYHYQVEVEPENFHFRLEIHRFDDGYEGVVFRLDRYRLLAAFPQNDKGESEVIDDALCVVKDEFIDEYNLITQSKKR